MCDPSVLNRPTISLMTSRASRYPHSFPTRRSSDLGSGPEFVVTIAKDYSPFPGDKHRPQTYRSRIGYWRVVLDRKSTRLNSSHRCISYAVFCLKKNYVINECARVGLCQVDLRWDVP